VRRRSLIVVLLAAVLFGCGGRGGDSEAASTPSEDDQPADVDLPAAPAEDPNLPTLPESSSDTVEVEPTTTTAAPTTTTTIPPPVVPSDVLFDTGSADLKPEAGPYLDELATDIRDRHPDASLRFIGHTDSRGTEASNQDLSQRRAEAVLLWFAANGGFDPASMSASGAGESELLTPDVDSQGRFDEAAGAQNRRVEIEIQQ